jgi:hypothetical protein
MKNQGFSRQLLDRYKKSNWLMPVGTGAYKLANDTVNWTGALYAIQNQLIYFAWHQNQNFQNFIFPVSHGKTPYS